LKKKKIGPGRVTVVMMTCTLAVPTVAAMFGAYPANVPLELLTPALATGVLLGLAHLVLRPVLRSDHRLGYPKAAYYLPKSRLYNA
jgi:hypothetical protein